MTHRTQHRRPVIDRAPLASLRPWSPLFARLLLTVLLLLAWLWVVAPAFAQDSTPGASGDTYSVQPGDTLSQIAKDYDTTVSEIMRLNDLTDSDALYVGQELKVPPVGAPANQGVYAVHEGETLADIADAFGVPLSLLMAQNGIRNADSVTVGTELLIPEPPNAGTTPSVPTDQGGANTPTPASATATKSAATVAPTKASTNQNTPTPTLRVVPTSTTGAIEVYTPSATPSPEPVAVDGPQPDATLENGLWIHVVKVGETASEIAKLYGVPLANLLNVNGIADANVIRLGARLVLPGSNRWSVAPAAAATVEGSLDETTDATATPEPTTEPEVEATDTPVPTPTHFEEPTQPPTEEATVAPTDLPVEAPAESPAESPTDAPTYQPTVEPITDLAQTIATPAPFSDRPAASLNRTYTIRYGDSLTSIADDIGVEVEALARLNYMEVDTPLGAGDDLLLPATDADLHVVSAGQEYTVQAGDSLSAIAKQFGVSADDLMYTNGISDPNLVSVGEVLEVPGQTITGEGPYQRVGPARSGYYFYTVRPGDTLSELAENLNSTEVALMAYNNISDAATIYNGMELRVPFGAPDLPTRTPPVPISGTTFMVSVGRQQCWVFTGREVEYAWNCSTGDKDHHTKTGSFAVKSKIDMAQSNIWRLDMPYWLGIYDVGTVENGIHGLPISWRTGKKIWTELIGRPATFGCAMLGDENALTLYNLAYIGMPVHIVR